MKLYPLAFTPILALTTACTGSDKATGTTAPELDTVQTDTGFVRDPAFNYLTCPKAWSLEEAMADPDKFCSLRLPNDAGEYTAVPPEIERMHYLIDLDLHANLITELPDFLVGLERLDIGQNGLKAWPAGLEKLVNLKRLSLSYNQLKSLSDQIGKLQNLEHLELFQNALTALPPALFTLTKLTKLGLSGNKLASLPPSIGKLQNLQELYVADQYATMLVLPDEMRQLKRLKILFMGSMYYDGANLYDSIPECIFSLDSLTDLSIMYSNLNWVDPKIANLKQLQSLDLTGNNLTSLPPEIAQLEQLKSLSLGENNFSDEEAERIRSWFDDEVTITFEVEYGD